MGKFLEKDMTTPLPHPRCRNAKFGKNPEKIRGSPGGPLVTPQIYSLDRIVGLFPVKDNRTPPPQLQKCTKLFSLSNQQIRSG